MSGEGVEPTMDLLAATLDRLEEMTVDHERGRHTSTPDDRCPFCRIVVP